MSEHLITIDGGTTKRLLVAGKMCDRDILITATGGKPVPTYVEQATPEITVDSFGVVTATATQEAGYVEAGTKTATMNLPTKAETTYTPTTSNQTIESGQYLTGTQTIMGDADLVAGNIKKGVSIFGVTGTLETESGGTDNSNAILDKSITQISNSTLTELGAYALRDCRALTTIDLPAVIEIGTYACYGCNKLTSVNVPLASTIGQYAFYGCSALTSLTLPAVKSLGNRAVSCSKLETLDLGVCTALNANALNGCTVLDTIILRSNTLCSMADVNAVSGTCFASGKSGGIVYVPSALLANYRSATNWSTLYSGGTCTFMAIEGSTYE